MEHTVMAKMFKSLEYKWLKGFMEALGSIYEAAVVEFFTNEKVIAGTIVSFIANRKLELTKDVLAEAFGLHNDQLALTGKFKYKFPATLSRFRTRYFLYSSRDLCEPLLFIEPYFLRLPSNDAVVWSKAGGAEFVSLRAFDWYQFGDLNRRVEGARSSYRVRHLHDFWIYSFPRSFSALEEHCDILSMQMDSDLVIYRTTLVRTFQVVTICRVDKSEPPPLLSISLAAVGLQAPPPPPAAGDFVIGLVPISMTRRLRSCQLGQAF
ncbi:hypothetical protein F511_25706 [Dorcoceras hygrometricum]|uniref:Uncharacterized protein n=1 Tax=Dorcoceras hygrometricum TaxID=472368 RepID=A0A2Z7ASH1_9LAMI|nr:hypothetical protein F511_25706 [Dorcoceras hygrometricum]